MNLTNKFDNVFTFILDENIGPEIGRTYTEDELDDEFDIDELCTTSEEARELATDEKDWQGRQLGYSIVELSDTGKDKWKIETSYY